MRIALGSDHAGYDMKTVLAKSLTDWGHETLDLGTDNGTDSVTVTGTSASMVSFIFPTPLAVGTAYQVVVSSTSGPTCTIVNNTGNGTIEQTGAPTPVTVTCN